MPESPSLVITVDGASYTIRMGRLTAIDSQDFRAAVGMSLAQAIAGGSGDLDVIAGLVWLVRRKTERGLAYAKVAKELTYDSEISIEDPTDATEADSGEA